MIITLNPKLKIRVCSGVFALLVPFACPPSDQRTMMPVLAMTFLFHAQTKAFAVGTIGSISLYEFLQYTSLHKNIGFFTFAFPFSIRLANLLHFLIFLTQSLQMLQYKRIRLVVHLVFGERGVFLHGGNGGGVYLQGRGWTL